MVAYEAKSSRCDMFLHQKICKLPECQKDVCKWESGSLYLAVVATSWFQGSSMLNFPPDMADHGVHRSFKMLPLVRMALSICLQAIRYRMILMEYHANTEWEQLINRRQCVAEQPRGSGHVGREAALRWSAVLRANMRLCLKRIQSGGCANAEQGW